MKWPLTNVTDLLRPPGESASAGIQSQLRLHRLLTLLGAVIIPAFGPLHQLAHPDAYDPLWQRIGLSLLLVAFLAGSYGFRWLSRRYVSGLRLIMYLGLGWFIYLAAMNGFAPDCSVGLVLVFAVFAAVIGLGVESMRPLLGYLGIGLAATAGTASAFPGAYPGTLVLIVSMATVALVEGIALQRHLSVRRELRAREQHLEQRNARLNRFAGVVSHDLRNPLVVARGRLNLARDEQNPIHLAAVENALRRMDAIMRDVLALTRYGKTVAEDSLQNTSLKHTARAGWSHVNTADARLSIVSEATILADQKRLQRLLENLFRNAVEHGGNGVTIRMGKLEGGFFVEDDGPGIPTEKRDEVFDAGYSSRTDGTGLGLSIVRGIVEAHGWTLNLTKGTSGGARFDLTGVDRVSASGDPNSGNGTLHPSAAPQRHPDRA